MKLKDADTLFLRIFLLLLSAFLISSFMAYEVFHSTSPLLSGRVAPGQAATAVDAAPPSRHLQRPVWPQPRATAVPAPPWVPLGLDVIIKVVAGALAAFFGARALSLPMRRLSDAARALGQSLAPAAGFGGSPPVPLDEEHGTREVRETAQVFNDLARQLKTDFDTQRLMLATVSHDLRTPLTRLRMRLAELETHPSARRAIDDVRQMDELIDGLLALFRPPSPVQAGVEQRIDALALVQAIVDDLPAGGPVVTLSGRSLSTPCQPGALRRMVENLIGNAVRHSEADGPIDVSVTADGQNVNVQVADRGPGLSPEQLAKAGTPFLRWAGDVDDGNSRQGGLGLGLYITRALAERAGGGLSLAARPGGGLCATLHLPRAGNA